MVQIIRRGWSKSNHSDFSDRYADNWRSTTAKAHVSTAGVCCYCYRKPSQEVHHGHYRRFPTAFLLLTLLWFLLFPIGFLWFRWLLMVAIVASPVVLLLPQLPVKGKEVIGWDVFPVCGSTNQPGSCHNRLHNRGNWIIDKRNPKWGNHNKFSTICRLRLGWLILKLKADRRS